MYSDSEIPGRLRPIAVTVPAKWVKYKTNLDNSPLRRLRGSAGFYSHWDDHEFVNGFSPAESRFSSFGVETSINGRALYRRGVRAFRDYAPVAYSQRNGLYRTRRWGRNLELFFLDERSFRSAKADEGGVCNNPETGEPDVAPTLPQATRDVFALLVPALAQPVSQACLEAIRSTEVHATLVNDARFQTLEPGGPRNSGILDVTVGPAATANFALEIDRKLDASGVGPLVDRAAFETQPPSGIGMQCSILDQFSYGQVRVTANRLTITPKGIDGRPQLNDGRPCGPFVLEHERPRAPTR
jgi:hypothetical protein